LAGIYIHIPFCKHKCNYCNFFSLATTRFREEFFQALLKEIELTRDYLGEEPVETLYFGGGTPSLFSVDQIEKIIQQIRDEGGGMRDEGRGMRDEHREPSNEQRATSIEAPEITLEMNPDDVTQEYISNIKQSPINRISLGVQSFFDVDLKYLERRHDGRQAKRALKMILLLLHTPRYDNDAGYQMPDTGSRMPDKKIENRKSKIETVSVDLIYGIPTLSNDHWKENLNLVIDLGVPHISAYSLTVEPKTHLAWQIARDIRHPVSDDQASEQFEILMEVMDQAGYLHYEISNFCLPGYESRHNRNYWRGIPYLGLGPSAHSFNGTSRRWNTRNLTSYIQGIESGSLSFEEEILTTTQHYNEYVMTSLRTTWGCDIKKIEKKFGVDYASHFRHQVIRHQVSGHLEESAGIHTLSRSGKFLADGISADLFVEK